MKRISDEHRRQQRTVLALDVDGTLLDSDRGGRGRWDRELEQRFGVRASDLEGAFFHRGFHDVIVGRTAIRPVLTEALAEIGWAVDVDEVLGCWFEADFHPFVPLVSAVSRWADQGARVVLVTNQEQERAAYLQQRLADMVPLAGMAYSAQLGCAKPEPEFFARASEMLGIGGDDHVVFVDDLLVNVEAAREHGWRGVHFDRAKDWHAEIATAIAVVASAW